MKQTGYSGKIVGLILGLLLTVSGARADRHVSTSGSNEAPYDTPETAARDIQTAVTAADSDETVWISEGRYELESTITFSKRIAICGNPGEEVIIDGKGEVQCFRITANTCILSNLFITGGNNADGSGGGVNMRGGLVVDCVFSNNAADRQGGGFYSGSHDHEGEIKDCLFVHNNARQGGGLSVTGVGDYTLKDCHFTENKAENCTQIGGSNYRGAAGAYLNGTIYMTNCEFIDNTSEGLGGAIMTSFNVGSVLAGSLFESNTAVTNGGGGYFSGHGTISNCIFKSNEAGQNGGGIYIVSGELQFEQCVVESNSSASAGGGGYIGQNYTPRFYHSRISGNSAGSHSGGLYCGRNSTPFFANCLISNNDSQTYGAGMRIEGPAMLINCAVVGNVSETSASGGISYSGSTSTNINCIVYYNESGNLTINSDSDIVFSNSCVTPALASSYLRSGGNITDEPQFADPTAGDFRLLSTSPCINQGIRFDDLEGEYDLDGRPRADRFSGLVDIGCYEYIPAGVMFRLR